MAQHGTASHYWHKGLKGVTSCRGTAWHSWPLLTQGPHEGLTKARKTRVAQLGTASHYIHGALAAVKGDNLLAIYLHNCHKWHDGDDEKNNKKKNNKKKNNKATARRNIITTRRNHYYHKKEH